MAIRTEEQLREDWRIYADVKFGKAPPGYAAPHQCERFESYYKVWKISQQEIDVLRTALEAIRDGKDNPCYIVNQALGVKR